MTEPGIGGTEETEGTEGTEPAGGPGSAPGSEPAGSRLAGPLAGRAVLITRAADQAADLMQLLVEAGAEPIAFPTVAFFPPVDPRPLDGAIAKLQTFAWIAFTSGNAVQAFFERLGDNPLEKVGAIHLAAVGPKTAEAIEQWGAKCHLTAGKGNAASLADGLARVCRQGDRVLYPRAERVSDDLAGRLRSFQVGVDDPIAYRTVPPTADSFEVANRLKDGTIHWIAAMSGSALRHLQVMLPEPEHLRKVRVASIGPRTSIEAAALGLKVGAEAQEPSSAALVTAILAAEGHA